MWRKSIDDDRLNDLFEIKLIFFTVCKSYVAIFSICMDAKLCVMRRL